MNGVDRLLEVIRKPVRNVIGLMSGTSVDAIDVALIEIEGHAADTSIRQVAFESFPYPAELRLAVFEQFKPGSSSVDQICHLDFLLGEIFAEAILATLEKHSISPEVIDLVGTVGQTIWHDPSTVSKEAHVEWVRHPIATRSTLAIGQSAVIAERTGILTVGELRVRDVAAGGEGAPLVAYADWVLLRHPERNRCVQNIGGIGNVTWLPAGGGIPDVIAFDTGPGNMIIDALVEISTRGTEQFDRDGRIADSGTVRDDLIAKWLRDPYFALPPPKTTGRERFGTHHAMRLIEESPDAPFEDLIASATALTARSIADAYERFIRPRGTIHEVIIGGGGARNPALMKMIRESLPDSDVLFPEDVGLDNRAKEAVAIAVMANDSLAGLTTNVPGATGGKPAILGKINL